MMDFLAAVYRMDVIDYGDGRAGRGLMVTAGSGLLMGLMDQLPAFRWAIDLDCVPPGDRMQIEPWLRCAEKVARPLAFAGWYSATDPSHVAAALKRLRRPLMVYARCLGSFGDPFASLRTAHDLPEFLAQCRAATAGTPSRVSHRAEPLAALASAAVL